jgi:cell cycle checkpoint protein
MESGNANNTPLFSAVSGSARQLFQLLRCINLVPKAHVEITKGGLRFTVEESQVMQGLDSLSSHRLQR